MNLFEFLYYLGFSIKKRYSLRNLKRLPHKVISIGNITVGGTGKTPATIAVAGEAKRRGFYPVILTRGYKGGVKGPCFVTTGERPLLTVDKAGDEPFLMAEKLKEIPIVKGINRYDAGMFAIRELLIPSSLSADPLPLPTLPTGRPAGQAGLTPNPLLFILDDGFQQWGLYRDMDIVLIDYHNPFSNGKLLPFGRLREPLGSLGRADVIVITKSERTKDIPRGEKEDLIKEIKQYNAKSPIFFAEHKPVSIKLLSSEEKPLSWASGKKFFGFCALASPESFKKTVRSTGAELVGFKRFRDHYEYRSEDMLRIKREAEKTGAEWIVTTEKDIIKTRDIDLPENILIIEIEFSVEEEFFGKVFGF